MEDCSKISLDHFFRRVRTLLIPQTWVIKPKLSMKHGLYRHFALYSKQERFLFVFLFLSSERLSDNWLEEADKREKPDSERFELHSCLKYTRKCLYFPIFTDSFGLITQVWGINNVLTLRKKWSSEILEQLSTGGHNEWEMKSYYIQDLYETINSMEHQMHIFT